jgi:hypothetical protein
MEELIWSTVLKSLQSVSTRLFAPFKIPGFEVAIENLVKFMCLWRQTSQSAASSEATDNYGKQCRNFISFDLGICVAASGLLARPTTCCFQTENADFEAAAVNGQSHSLFCRLLIYLCCECHQIFPPDYSSRAKKHCRRQLYGTLSEQIFNLTSSRIHREATCVFIPENGEKKVGRRRRSRVLLPRRCAAVDKKVFSPIAAVKFGAA